MHQKTITYKDSKLKILCEKDLFNIAEKELIKQRTKLEKYADKEFLGSLKPVKAKLTAPKIAKVMYEASEVVGVGPMAAVAGTTAEIVAKKLIKKGAQTAIVENGGDIFAITSEEIIIGLFVGSNKLTGKLAIKLDKDNTPISICSSSSVMGHSKSLGNCDLATVFSKKAAIADAASTKLANMIKDEEDLNKALKKILKIKDVNGAIAIKGSKIGMIGKIPPLVKTDDKNIEKKVTRF